MNTDWPLNESSPPNWVQRNSLMSPVLQQQLVAAATKLGSERIKTRDAERRISGCSPTQESLAIVPVPMLLPRHLRVRERPHGASATTDLPTGGMRYARYSVRVQSLAAASQASGCRKVPPHCRFAKKGDDVNVVCSYVWVLLPGMYQRDLYEARGGTCLQNLTVCKQVPLWP
jgi:hypothetical protein